MPDDKTTEKQGGGQSQTDGKPVDDKVPTYENFDAFLAAQSDEVRTLHKAHEAGLKGALQKEREAREDTAKQLREAAKAAEENPTLKAQLEKLATDQEAANRRADFYEAASKPEVGITNLKLAYTVAVADELFDKKGNVDFKAMKADYPELFASEKPAIPGHGGTGRRGEKTGPSDMNETIRELARRG